MVDTKSVKMAIRETGKVVEDYPLKLSNIVDILHNFETESWNDVVSTIRKIQRNGECLEARNGFFRLI